MPFDTISLKQLFIMRKICVDGLGFGGLSANVRSYGSAGDLRSSPDTRTPGSRPSPPVDCPQLLSTPVLDVTLDLP